MALQPTLTPYLRRLAVTNTRTFAAAAASKKSSPSAESYSSIPREELKVSKVGDVTVASVETNKPLSKLAVYLRAGSRFETDETQGVAQMLRICAGLGTKNNSHFSTTRTIEQEGGVLTCSMGREWVGYTVEGSRGNINNLSRFVKELGVYQVFKPWEVKDNEPRLRLERKIRSPEVRILELVHKAAYRKGLGYSLYSPKWMIGNHSSEMLQNFVKNNFVEASIVATGMNHEELKVFAQNWNLNDNKRNVPKSKFSPGSELRKETGSKGAVLVALAIEGASLSNPKDVLTAGLVQRALGAGSRIKRGQSAGKLAAAASGDAAVSAFNLNYSDSGLLGVVIKAEPKAVEAATKKSAELLLSGGFTDADLARAKNLLKLDIASATDSDGGLLEEIGLQTLLTGNVVGPEEVNGLIDSVTAADLNKLVSGGKLSMASFGRIANVPHIDQLK